MSYVIRPMREEDLPQAAAIEKICFTSEAWSEKVYREEFERSANRAGADPSIEKKDALPREATVDRLFLCSCAYLWLWAAADEVDDTRVLGAISLTRVGDDGEIGNVAVLPKFRRQGIARKLLTEAIRFGEREQNLQAFTLEVRAGNAAAIRLYEAAGFHEEGRRPRFYTEPVEDALIMWRRKERETKGHRP